MPIPDHYQEGASDLLDSAVDPDVLDKSADLAADRFFTASEEPRVKELRGLIQGLGQTIDVLVPPGRNKALALTALEDVQMRANRGIFAPEELR